MIGLTTSKLYRRLKLLAGGQVIMSSETFDLVYDGEALAAHQMDVSDLVPALQGLGSAIREANADLNQNRATVRVLINSEHKPGSFSTTVEIVQEITSFAGMLLGADSIRSANELLQLLDLFGMGSKGLLGFLKWRDGKEIEPPLVVKDVNGQGQVQVVIKGDNNTIITNNITISEDVFRLSANPQVAKSIKQILQPLKSSGIESLETKRNGRTQAKITRADAKQIEASCEAAAASEITLSQDTHIAHLRPYDAKFNEDAKTWQFWHGDKHITADISATNIAKEAVTRRAVSMDDIYKVDLQVTETKSASGSVQVKYKVVRVIEEIKGPSQIPLLS